MSDNHQGRFILATLDKTTGTHQIHNWPTRSHSGCIEIAQSMQSVAETKHRLIFRSHDDSGEPQP